MAVGSPNSGNDLHRVPLPPFELTREPREGKAVVSVRGEIDLHTSRELASVLEDAVGREEPVVLHLAECGFLDSTGIALIVRADQRLRGSVAESGVTLCGVRGQVRKVLEVSGLAATLDIRASRDEAL